MKTIYKTDCNSSINNGYVQYLLMYQIKRYDINHDCIWHVNVETCINHNKNESLITLKTNGYLYNEELSHLSTAIMMAEKKAFEWKKNPPDQLEFTIGGTEYIKNEEDNDE